MTNGDALKNYWSLTSENLVKLFDTSPHGLSSVTARKRLKKYGFNTLDVKSKKSHLSLFFKQLANPLIIILIVAAIISAILHNIIDASIILIIVIGSSLISSGQERNAAKALEELQSRVKIKSMVMRDGICRKIVSDMIVPGDIILLSAGSMIPADGIVLECKDFYVNQSVLTGETFPAEKRAGSVSVSTPLSGRTNAVFMGTSVNSGTASILAIHTGKNTQYGQISHKLALHSPKTEFERGVSHFGYLLTRLILVIVLVVFAVNLLTVKPPIASLLFAIALAVGMTPELLPAIITITLSKGAKLMAESGVIVRNLNAIENFGSMDVLCIDKTGTLTEGTVKLAESYDAEGKKSQAVLTLAGLNAHFQAGLMNPLDHALLRTCQKCGENLMAYTKIDEIPYDFVRKRLSVIVAKDSKKLLITKGALNQVLQVCSSVQIGTNIIPIDKNRRDDIISKYSAWSSEGYRILGVAHINLEKEIIQKKTFDRNNEKNLIFDGFLVFFDPPRRDIRRTLDDLKKLGIQIKIITGDNKEVTTHIAESIGIESEGILTGSDISRFSDEALMNRASNSNIFVEVDPNQKERIIHAFRKMGNVVGYMGDGINDVTAMHASDVSISVDKAVDIAKKTADFVLLKHELPVLRNGIMSGRKIFANTMKYIFTTTSANFGNMFSLAIASVFLPFLPLVAKQILLNNFLSDLPAMTIASDNVDDDLINKPRRWDVKRIRNFMITFGLVSSVFDFLTFVVLLFLFHASIEQFRTGWFIESSMTELLFLLVARTSKPFYKSIPGKYLILSIIIVSIFTLALPYLPHAVLMGFMPLSIPLISVILLILIAYIIASDYTKRWLFNYFQ